MGKTTRERPAKTCDGCQDTNQDTLFRVRESALHDWIFACDKCKDKIKQTASTYEYGGTWKRKKRN